MQNRRLTKDGSYTLYSERYKQTYHSINGSRTEAEHVFLRGTGIAGRLERLPESSVLEVGFGTGLNFLLTADLALMSNASLTYWAYERQLPDPDELQDLNYDALLKHPPLCEALLAWQKTLHDLHEEGLLTWRFSDRLTLHLITGDATRAPAPDAPVDAIYLDAFSPDENPELWTIPFLQKLYDALKSDGTLATYSAKSLVRKNLMEAGFAITKRPGPPGKREMLTARKI